MVNINFDSPNERFSPLSTAIAWAGQAAQSANNALHNKSLFIRYEKLLRKWDDLTVNSSIWAHTGIFLIFAIVDIAISYPLFRDVIRESGLFVFDSENPEIGAWPIFLVSMLLAILLNAWAAVTAHFIAKGWYKEHQDLERWNLIFIKLGGEYASPEVETYMRKEISRAKWLAFVSAFVLLTLVAFLLYHRYYILSNTLDGLTSGTYVQTFLPFAIIIGEIITGDYVWFLILRMVNRRKRNRYRGAFLRFKNETHLMDGRAYELYKLAEERQDMYNELPKDLKLSLFRVRNRTAAYDNYADSVDGHRHTTFVVKHSGTLQPLSETRVFGVLPNGAKTSDYYTNSRGEVTIYWSDEFDRVELLHLNDRDILGPFASDGTHHVEYQKLPDLKHSLNGNGKSAKTTAK